MFTYSAYNGVSSLLVLDRVHVGTRTLAFPCQKVIMFFRQNAGAGGPSLFSIDLSGYNEQRVPTPAFSSDPAWSPLLE